jgi:hypothetical protein
MREGVQQCSTHVMMQPATRNPQPATCNSVKCATGFWLEGLKECFEPAQVLGAIGGGDAAHSKLDVQGVGALNNRCAEIKRYHR